MELTNEEIEKIQSIIIEKIERDKDTKQEAELNKLLDKIGMLKSYAITDLEDIEVEDRPDSIENQILYLED